MADAELKVRIDAEIGEGIKNAKGTFVDFSRTIGELETKLNTFRNGIKNATSPDSIARLNRAIEATKGKISDLNNFNQAGGQSLKSFSVGSSQAAFALNNLSRVAQDAPFGFIGIQNNLNPLLESFQRLKSETGSTGGALKALGSSLLGAGGLGFALSAISAGILFYQQSQSKANKVVESAKKSTDEYANSLGQVQRAQLVGAQSAAQETTTLNLLFKQYTNGQLTLEKRKSAYEELQRLYPAYFGNIKFEQEASTKTKDAYDRLTTSILATARARAAGDLITKNSQRQLENEQKLIDLGIVLSKEKANADKQRQIALASIGTAGQEGTGSIIATNNEIKALKQVEAIQKQINNIKTDSAILTNQNLQLEKSINAEVEKGANLSGSVGAKAISNATKLNDIDKERFQRDEKISIKRLNSLDDFLAKYRATEAKLNKTPLIALPENIKTKIAEPFDNLKLNILPELGSSFKTFFDEILIRGNLSFASLGKSIISTFASVLASQATTGVLALLGDKDAKAKGNIFGVVGKALGIGGKLLGKGAAGSAGVGSAATGTAATGGLLLPILGGIAAVAGIASLFKKKQPSPQPAYSTSTASTSSVSSVDFGGGRVVFEISGVNLVGVLNRAGAKLQRFGP